MKVFKQTYFLLAAFVFISMLMINSCGDKGGGVTPPPPNPCTGITITVTGTVTNTTTGQSVGAINATASGSSSFTYNINGGAFQASGNFTGLPVGTYTIIAKNADGCTGTNTFTVNDPCTIKNITVTGTVVNTTAGTSNGSITATAAGSTGFTYSLNGGAFQASGTFNGLTAGSYTVTAKDLDGCTKSQSFTITLDPCLGKTLTISAATTAHDKCSIAGTGTITITATGGTGFTYNLNGGAFQASNVFTGLSPNTYSISAKDIDGCIKTGSAAVNEAPAGFNFSAVRAVLQANCALSGCHSGSSPTGGLNFTLDCTIVGSWDRIKARAVDGNPSFMPPPPNPQLSAADKQKILNWIAAGHRYTD